MAELKRIPVALPVFGEEEEKAAVRAIRSGWVTQGPEVAAFEKEFAAYVGAPHACAVSNCTTALHLALLAAGVGPGDEVVTVSLSFIATANSVRYCGATPVFVDVEPDGCNIDPLKIEEALTEKTTAILCVHQLGMPCDLEAVLEIAARRGLVVVEDAACAIGSEIRFQGNWEKIGRPHGDIACFSFHPRKTITTGDGGMVTTSREDWAERIRRLRHNGMGVSDRERHESGRVIFESYPELGYNYRMTDIQAAVGREQLKRVDDIVAVKRRLVQRYRELLADVSGIILPREPAFARTNWQTFCVELREGLDQRTIMQRLLDQGVAARRGVMCAHLEAAYPPGTWKSGPSGLARSQACRDRGLILPLYYQMADSDVERVVDALGKALGG